MLYVFPCYNLSISLGVSKGLLVRGRLCARWLGSLVIERHGNEIARFGVHLKARTVFSSSVVGLPQMEKSVNACSCEDEQ